MFSWFRKKERPRFASHSPVESYAETMARMDAERKAAEKAEWDALPDHRKAARLEYKMLTGLGKKRVNPDPYSDIYNMAQANNRVASLWAGMQQSQMDSLQGAYYRGNSSMQGAAFGSNPFRNIGN